MKKIIFFLLVSVSCFAQTSVKNGWGANGFIVQQYWPGTYEYLPKAKLRRLYMDNSVICPATVSGDKFYLTNSWQGFPIKDQLTQLKNLGTDVIWCTQGGFWNSTLYTDTPPSGPARFGARINQLMPIMDRTANVNLPATYNKFARLCFNVARMYGNNPAGGLLTSEVSTGSDTPSFYPTLLTGGPNNNGTGLNLIKYIEVQNEWNLSEVFGLDGGEVKFNSQSFAVCFKAAYDAIKLGDPNMKVILGAIYNDGNIQTQNALITQLQSVFGGTIPSDVIFNFHIYMIDPLAGVEPITPKTPENIVIPANILNRSLTDTYIRLINEWDKLGYPWMVTEFGWDVNQGSDRRTPILSGVTGTSTQQAEKSMGILNVRLSILSMCAKRCVGTVFYWLNDDSPTTNTIRFASMGVYLQSTGDYLTGPPGAAKACLPYYNEFMDNMGDCILPLQLVRFTSGSYRAVGNKANGKKVMVTWTDQTEPVYQNIN